MKPISKKELKDALSDLGLTCKANGDGNIKNTSELNFELGLLLEGLPDEISIPDPTGDTEGKIFIQPSKAFASGVLLIWNSKVLLFGHDDTGGVLFVSEEKGGKVGFAYEVPDDMRQLRFSEPEEGKSYWDLEFLEWLRLYKKIGVRLFD